ncbi:hypothetical protein [Thalassospira lucentensis]|uniref:hypothetical protein n=1 Tax=Thalassospira lucentensis TaxID=168935 RepID=UPI003AA7CB0A
MFTLILNHCVIDGTEVALWDYCEVEPLKLHPEYPGVACGVQESKGAFKANGVTFSGHAGIGIQHVFRDLFTGIFRHSGSYLVAGFAAILEDF